MCRQHFFACPPIAIAGETAAAKGDDNNMAAISTQTNLRRYFNHQSVTEKPALVRDGRHTR